MHISWLNFHTFSFTSLSSQVFSPNFVDSTNHFSGTVCLEFLPVKPWLEKNVLPLSTLNRSFPAMLAAPEFALIYTVQWGKRERERESGLTDRRTTDGLVDIRIRSLLRTTQKIWKKGKGEGKTKADVSLAV